MNGQIILAIHGAFFVCEYGGRLPFRTIDLLWRWEMLARIQVDMQALRQLERKRKLSVSGGQFMQLLDKGLPRQVALPLFDQVEA